MDAESRLRRWLRPQLLQSQSYHVPDSRGLIKLDAMENPYALPDSLRERLLDALRDAPLNRYPDPQARELRELLIAQLGLADGLDLIFGNGSDELIQLLAIALAGEDRVVLAPTPGFVMYKVLAEALGMRFVGVPLGPDFSLDKSAMLEAIARHQPALVYLAYPNNPTGNLFDEQAMRDIIGAAPGLVVVDEAYSPFSARSFAGWLGQYDNLLLMRTLSKQGLAGLRLGYLLGPRAWIQELDKLRLPYNINVLTQIAARVVLEQPAELESQAREICESRQRLFAALGRLSGISVHPSDANFLLFRVPAGQGGRIFQGLLEQGILIKNLHGTPGLEDCLRVTVGTPQENASFLQALERIL
ncbi:histidinol-phosphate transaminase [Thermithiobacillus plumbiphilus]|uniref:Histidinol-phosphate aminotransferase n=1 Tax=Thermithiobacillus plumbiphilus TaxID=1729899 RepID=A0ABU9D5X5_9PROT